MRIPLLLLAFACATNAGRAADQQRPGPVQPANADVAALPEPTKDALAVAAGLNTFSWDLYRQLKTQPGNVFFSPFSIYTALNMTAGGAAGKTAAEFAAVLHALPDEQASHAGAAFLAHRHEQAKDYELAIANRLFGAQGKAFKAPFLTLCQDVYRAPLESVVFPEPGRTRINTWVEERTKERIKELIPDGGVSSDTKLVLVNAIYFKGTWAEKFDPSETKDGTFTVSADKTITAPFMHRTGDMRISKMKSATMVELPYAGGALAMNLIVPDELDGLNAVEQQLDANGIQAAIAGLQMDTIDLFLPRFTLRWGTAPLANHLKTLGLTSAFDVTAADFSRMSDRQTMVSEVFHQAFVAVDEAGTVATAATAVTVEESLSLPAHIKADRPFLFLIRDVKTKAVLFMGRVNDPS